MEAPERNLDPVLPREILKWLQSLDLSFAITHISRDFSNGFLFAEVLSRYFPTLISMHNFEAGSQLKIKRDNWDQLLKFFRKQNISITQEDFDPVINKVNGAANKILHTLYTYLTKRPIQLYTGQISPDEIETASKVASLAGSVANMKHSDGQSESGHSDAGRPLMDLSATRRHNTGRGQSRTVSATFEVSHLDIKDVEVKPLEKNVAQMRQNRTTQSAKSGDMMHPTTPGLMLSGGTGDASIEILRPAFTEVVGQFPEITKLLDPRKDIVVSFMELVDRINEQAVLKVFDVLAKKNGLLKRIAEVMVRNPTEFHKIFSLLAPILVSHSHESAVFDCVAFFFKRLGHNMVKAQPDTSIVEELFLDVALQDLVQVAKINVGKRETLAELAYSYSRDNAVAHVGVLRHLKESLEDLDVVVHVLSYLVPIEAQLGILADPGILDLYCYYAHMALCQCSARVRVSGLNILCQIVFAREEIDRQEAERNSTTSGRISMGPVLQLVDNFLALQHDRWWEVQAQLLQLAARLLLFLYQRPGDITTVNVDEVERKLVNLVERLFIPSNSRNILQVGLIATVHLLPISNYKDRFLQVFVEILLGQPAPLRQRLLFSDNDTSISGRLGVSRVSYVMGCNSRAYDEVCLRYLWNPLDIGMAFVTHICDVKQDIDHLEACHIELFESLVCEVEFANCTQTENDQWGAIFERLAMFIFVALIDPELHLQAANVLHKFWKAALGNRDATLGTFLQTLRVLYTPSLERSKVDVRFVHEFLQDVGNYDSQFVHEILAHFRDSFPEEFQNSNLEGLLG